MNPDQLRSYLLGRLPPGDREEIETRAFEDDTFDSQLQEAEADLLDDWARGQLVPADADRVQERFPPAKLDVALHLNRRHLNGKIGKPSPSSQKSRVLWWLATAAAALLILAPAIYFWPHSRPVATPQSSQARPAPARVEIAIVALRTPSTRGTAIPLFAVARSATVVRLTVPAIQGYSQYEFRLESAVRGQIARQRMTLNGDVLSVEFDASLIADGDYDSSIFATTGDVSDLLATYSFRVEKK